MNLFQKFAVYYSAAMVFAFLMFFVMKYLSKQEIFASLIGALLFAVPMTFVFYKKQKVKK